MCDMTGIAASFYIERPRLQMLWISKLNIGNREMRGNEKLTSLTLESQPKADHGSRT
jgi:hypothetical protein